MLLGVPFGKVVNVLLLKHKNQAFLEMAEPAAAAGLVSYYNTVPATIRYASASSYCTPVCCGLGVGGGGGREWCTYIMSPSQIVLGMLFAPTL